MAGMRHVIRPAESDQRRLESLWWNSLADRVMRELEEAGKPSVILSAVRVCWTHVSEYYMFLVTSRMEKSVTHLTSLSRGEEMVLKNYFGAFKRFSRTSISQLLCS